MTQAQPINKDYGVRKTAIVIAVFTVLAKILGLARDAVFSNMFGTGEIMDAYFAAFRLPDFIFNLLILGTFSVAFIPVFSDYLINDRKRAYDLASSILNATLAAIVMLTCIAYIFIDPLVNFLAPGLTEDVRETTKLFASIFLLSPIFLTLSSIVSSILNADKKFALVAAAPIMYNFSIIFGAAVLYPRIGAPGLAWGVVLGAVLHLLIQVPGILKVGFKYNFKIDYKDPAFRQFWKLYWPRVLSMGTSQVTLLIVTFFGSFLGTGALSSFYYANNLQSVFLSIFAVSFAVAVFPMLSDLHNEHNTEGFINVIAKTTNQILFFIIPLSALMLVLRAQIVRLVLGVGAGTNFNFADTQLVALSLGLFVVSLFAQSLIPLYSRAFYARHNTYTPMIVGFGIIAINAMLTYMLVGRFGVPGMVFAFSAASIIHLIVLLMELHRSLGSLRDDYLLINTLKIVIASGFAAVATYASLYILANLVNMQTYWGILIQGGVSGIIGVLGYLMVAWALKADESDRIWGMLKSMINKTTKPFTGIMNIWN